MLKIRIEKQTHFVGGFKTQYKKQNKQKRHSTKLSQVYMILSSKYIKENFLVLMWIKDVQNQHQKCSE